MAINISGRDLIFKVVLEYLEGGFFELSDLIVIKFRNIRFVTCISCLERNKQVKKSIACVFRN